MNTKYWNKALLYHNIDKLRQNLGVCLDQYPIDSKQLAYTCIKNLIIQEVSFDCDKICGILYKGKHSASIALNSNHSSYMQNFDCMHELVHYFFHDVQDCQRICYDEKGGKIAQDTYIEWQANEGAAQFLVPYQDFIPRFLSCRLHSICNIQEILANYYHVSEYVISIRINNLSYEIDQYSEGVPLEDIKLLSRKQREKEGIRTTCYSAVCDFYSVVK